MRKILALLCVLGGLLCANELDTQRIKQGDFTQLEAYLKQLDSKSKKQDLSYKEYQTLTRFVLVDGIDGVYNGGSNREFDDIYYSKLAPFLAEKFGDLFVEHGLYLSDDGYETMINNHKDTLYSNLVFWFNDANLRNPKQIFTTQKSYESFLFFKRNATLGTITNKSGEEETNCSYGDGGGGACEFVLTNPIKVKGKLTLHADFSLPPNGLEACSPPAYFNTFETKDSRLALINGGEVELEDPKHYAMFAPILPKWYKEGLGGSVSYEVEIDLTAVMPWSFSACADGKAIHISNINVLTMLADYPNDRRAYEKALKDIYAYSYKLRLHSPDPYVNLRDKPNGKILTQISTKDSDKILLINLSASLWEIEGVSEWQRQVGHEMSEDNSPTAPVWVKVLYFPPNVQALSQAKIGYIHHSQLLVDRPDDEYEYDEYE